MSLYILIFLLIGLFGAVRAMAYGTWEYKNGNKVGGISMYLIAIFGITFFATSLFI